jgi:phosphohistidine phosphatase
VIWLLRHGDAEQAAEDDASRQLTTKGERQARAAGAALAELGAGIERCLTSPKVRAAETARLACEPLGVEVEPCDALRGGDFEPGELADQRTTLLVGHEPDFSRAVEAVSGARIELKKGGVAVLDGPLLVALLRPAQLLRIATRRQA